MNLCQAKHPKHKLIKVNTVQGEMWVYDTKLYKGYKGYCTGQDDVSDTLTRLGSWEVDVTKLVKELLLNGNKENLVLDFGSHVGWFTLLASKLGYDVHAFDGEPENIDTLQKNVTLHDLNNRVSIHRIWIDKSFSLGFDRDIELLKCDIEGSEKHVVNACKALFEAKKIKFAILEISPTFNDSYPELVKFIESCGYGVYDIEQSLKSRFDGDFDFAQSNFLFKRVD